MTPMGTVSQTKMGIIIQFPQAGSHAPSEQPPSGTSGAQDVHFPAAAYRRDLDRAVSLLLEHVESGAYDGVALILKPTSQTNKPALVVGGFYRHRLTEAADAALQLHLAIKLRAREQAFDPQACNTSRSSPRGSLNSDDPLLKLASKSCAPSPGSQ